MNEVVVSTKRIENYKREIVGFTDTSKKKFGYWKGGFSLGGEMVTKIKANKVPRRLDRFQFHIRENQADSLLIRINVYKGNSILPKGKLNKANIYHITNKDYGTEIVDLTKFNIYVEDDFMIGLELLMVYGGKSNYLELSASDVPGDSFRRYASQGKWEKFRGDAMTFSVETSAILNDRSVYDISREQALVELESSFDNNPLEMQTKIATSVFKEVNGMVFTNGRALENVHVGINNSGTYTTTDIYGRYSIMAKIGDQLTYSFMGMETEVKLIDPSTNHINVNLYPLENQLENVVVTADKNLIKSEEIKFKTYNQNTDLVKTRGGVLDKTTSSGAVEIVDFELDRAVNSNMMDLLAYSFSGVKVGTYEGRNGSVEALFLRGRGSILNPRPAVFEVDGMVYEQLPDWINTENIKRVAKISGVMATSKYGSVAMGGIFVLNTKSANFSPQEWMLDKNGNHSNKEVYQGDAISIEDFKKSFPQYLNDLNGASSLTNALDIYNQYQKMYGNFPYFYLDALDYFLDNWDDDIIVEEIENQLYQMSNLDLKHLIALAFIYEKNKFSEKALNTYAQIYSKRPNDDYSYLSLARAYEEVGQYNKSAEIYARYTYLLNKEFIVPDTLATHEVIVTEFEKLLKNHSDQMNIEVADRINQTSIQGGHVRVVVEYNDPSAEFMLQFVDSDQKFFIWNNFDSRQNSLNGGDLVSKQFEIVDQPGKVGEEWLVNVTYKGNDSMTPMYLKVIVYQNYGLSSETKHIEFFRLGLKEVNHELLRINNLTLN